MGRIDEASAQFDAAVAEDSKLALVGLGGLIALKQGNYREAVKHFDAMLEAEPTQARTYYERGRAWCELGEYEKALHDFDEAVAYAEQGDFDEAVRWQTKALATVPEEERAWCETLLENYRDGIPRRMPEEKGRWDLGCEGDPSDGSAP